MNFLFLSPGDGIITDSALFYFRFVGIEVIFVIHIPNMRTLGNIGRFLISLQFLKHVGLGLLTMVLLFYGTMWYLKSYTRFGEENYISVPSLVGMNMNEVEGKLSPIGLKFTVDSVATDKFPKGTVIAQDPGPTDSTGQFVKADRTIYITVVSLAPLMVSMPDLVYKSKKHAEGILRIVGLKVKYTYKPYSDCKDCVIEQKFKNRPITAGDKVEKGSTIELVLGQGKGGGNEVVPDLMGKTIDEANSSLNTVALSLYSASCEGCFTRKDSLQARIYRQSPGAGSEAASGSEVTVWRSMDPEKIQKP